MIGQPTVGRASAAILVPDRSRFVDHGPQVVFRFNTGLLAGDNRIQATPMLLHRQIASLDRQPTLVADRINLTTH